MNNTKKFALAGAVAGWVTLAVQFYLIMQNRQAGVGETVVRFFSFFTILTNILVAATFSSAVKNSIVPHAQNFLLKYSTLTATAVYISIVAIIYNTILRFIWTPQGIDRLVDEMLHVFLPVMYIIFWWKFVPRSVVPWNKIIPWLAYPLLYLCYSLVRGYFVHWYPYPFLNADVLGYERVLLNSAGVTAVFVVVSVIFVGITKRR